MKITDVTVTLFAWDTMPVVGYHGVKRSATDVHDQGLVTIHTDEGLEGHAFLGKGLSPASSDAALMVKYLKPLLVGQDPLDRELLHEKLWKRKVVSSIRTIGAIDVALWDLAGKIAGLPIYKLLGGYRTSIPAYVSSDHLPTPQHYADEAVKYKELGYIAYKIHPPENWRDDIKVCEAVRKAVGDDYMLMLDSTFSYQFEEALRVGRAIEEMGYYWYEDPLGDHDIYNYIKLKQKLDIPIMATERPEAGLEAYAPWITSQATDFLRGDVLIKGGITNVMKTAHLAEAFRMKYEVHTGGNSLANLANLHIEMSIRNTQFHELLLPLEAMNYGVVNEITVDRNGLIHAPTGPGLGAEIDFAMIEKKKIAVLK